MPADALTTWTLQALDADGQWFDRPEVPAFQAATWEEMEAHLLAMGIRPARPDWPRYPLFVKAGR